VSRGGGHALQRRDRGATIDQALPLADNGLFHVLEGKAPHRSGGHEGDAVGTIRIANAGAEKLRLLLYAGQWQNVPIVSHGPFIGDTRQDIVRSFERYHAGLFRHY
jgi:redox-sensitive bicupin YhaK (pirin superfamily)